MANFIPDHIKHGYDPDDPETMYEDVPGVFIDEKEEDHVEKFVETGEYVPKSEEEISIIRNITSILTDAGLNLDEIEEYVKEIDFSLPRDDILDAFRKFAETDMSIKFELEYLYPVFTRMAEPKIIKDLKVKTATEITEGRPGFVPITPISPERVPEKRELKPEKELPQLVTSDAMRSKYVEKMMKGEEITCKLCGHVINPDEIRTWWLSIYPAHLDCVHDELNRRADAAGRVRPFPE